jgi:hypothetical protein
MSAPSPADGPTTVSVPSVTCSQLPGGGNIGLRLVVNRANRAALGYEGTNIHVRYGAVDEVIAVSGH